MTTEASFAIALQWVCFTLSFFSFGFYAYKVRTRAAPTRSRPGAGLRSPAPGVNCLPK
jgi:hypothetical protein